MVDADEDVFIANFTKPVQTNLVFWNYSKNGAGFAGNFKAFFESIERTAIARNVIKKALFYIMKK
jgi:4-hydroxyphenylpyruvate dioxygenase-like putative hemolysin